MRNHILLSTIALALVLSTTVRAQSLADVAAAEARRRKAQTRPTKVYTNDDLTGTAQEPAEAASAVAGAADTAKTATASPAAANGGKPADTAKPEQADEKKTESYWRNRVTTIEQSLARHKVLTDAMQSRINALNVEALSVDDPGRHAMLQSNLTTAVGEMERLKAETDKLNKDLAATREEARRANIPPGWLR
jgi:hypothetical protein